MLNSLHRNSSARPRSAVLGSLSAIMALLLASCSPSMFSSKNDVDPKVVKQPTYRTINPDCSGLDLSSSKLKSRDARKFLACLNSNQSVEPMVKLVNRLSDEEFDALLDVGNRQFIDQPQRLHEVDRTWSQLKAVGAEKNLVVDLGKALRHPELTLAAGQALGRLRESDPQSLDPLLLALSKKLDRNSLRDLLAWSLDVSGAKVFQSVIEDLKADSATGLSIDDAAAQLSAFARATLIRADGTQDRDPLLDMFKKIRSGAMLPVFDVLHGTTPDQMRVGIARFGGLMRTLTANGAADLKSYQALMDSLKGSVPCMKGAYSIPDLRRYALDELYRVKPTEIRSYLSRSKPNELSFENTLCDFPAAFLKATQGFESFANGPAVDESQELALAFHNGGMESCLISLIDPQSNGLNKIFPLFSEMTARGLYDDILLTVSLAAPGVGRNRMQNSLGWILDPLADGKSLQDQVMGVLAQLEPSEIAAIMRAALPRLQDPEAIAHPLLETLRTSLEINASEPLLSLAREELANADFRQRILPVLLKVSKMPEADAALRWASEMGESGELVSLIDTVLSLFHRYSEGHATTLEIPALTVAPFVPARAHDLARSDLMDWKLAIRQSSGDADLSADGQDPYASCRSIDLTLLITDTANGSFNAQMKNVARCMSAGSTGDLAGPAMDYLASTTISDGHTSLIQHLVQDVKKLNLPASDLHDWISRLNQANDRGDMASALQAVPLLVHGVDGESSITRPLLDLFAPVVGRALQQWQRIESLGADLLRRSDLAPVIGLLRTLNDRDSPLPPPKVSVWEEVPTKNRIRELVQNRECYTEAAGINGRTKQIISDFENGVTSYELVGTGARTSFSDSEMTQELTPTINKLADVSSGTVSKSVVRALLNVIHYFTLKPGESLQQGRHYIPEDLGRWLHDRSEDYRSILYFYPGENQARVKLVNSLDRLELVLYNAYFTYLLPDNNGQKFLQMIGDSWGDEPRSVWPAEVQAQYAPGTRPPTLRETYNKMAGTLKTFGTMIGYPKVQDCTPSGAPGDGLQIPHGFITVPGWLAPGIEDVKNRLFNMQMVLPVIEENLPDSAGANRGGMRVIRDLFYELASSTPSAYRNPRGGERNNLSVIYHLIRVGLMRQSGRLLRHPDPTFDSFFKGFVIGADAPGVEGLLNYLVHEDPQQQILWKALQASWKITPAGAEATYRAQQSMYYLFGLTGQDRFNIIPQVVGGLTEAIRSNHDFVLRNLDSLMLDGVASADLGNALQNLFTSSDEFGKNALGSVLKAAVVDPNRVPDITTLARVIDDDSQSKSSFKQVKDRWKLLKVAPAWTNIHASEILDYAVDFLTEEQLYATSPRAGEGIRNWLADRLIVSSGASRSDMDELVIAISKDPAGFHKVFEALAQASLPQNSNDPHSSSLQALIDRGERTFQDHH